MMLNLHVFERIFEHMVFVSGLTVNYKTHKKKIQNTAQKYTRETETIDIFALLLSSFPITHYKLML